MKVYCRGCNKEVEVKDEDGEYYAGPDARLHPKVDCDPVAA